MDKVIGALLGTASTDASGRVVVVARASYAIPCQDRDGELLMDVEFHKTMLGLHARVNPEERVVGWFSAGAASPETTAVVHEFFAKDAVGGTPVHVMLDAEFSGVEQGGDMLSASVGETVLATTDRESGARAGQPACALAKSSARWISSKRTSWEWSRFERVVRSRRTTTSPAWRKR